MLSSFILANVLFYFLIKELKFSHQDKSLTKENLIKFILKIKQR